MAEETVVAIVGYLRAVELAEETVGDIVRRTWLHFGRNFCGTWLHLSCYVLEDYRGDFKEDYRGDFMEETFIVKNCDKSTSQNTRVLCISVRYFKIM